jgi:phosphoribosyl 1,2-cyclic phosphodiesterase
MISLVRFWEVCGSIQCSDPSTARYGGNTFSVEMRCGGSSTIFDAGTGIRELGNSMKENGPFDTDILFSHTHFGHIIGMPFFLLLYCADNNVRL